MEEYLRLYALEGFLLRLSRSKHRNSFVLKGGVLLAAHDLRRPTTDIDMAALHTPNEVEGIKAVVFEVAATPVPEDLDDGLVFHLDEARAEAIREEDEYSGVRVRLAASLATARLPFHVDVNVGDPIWPPPANIWLPRLLGGEAIALNGYALELSIAEKVVTALQRGVTSTRWRDFGDLYLLRSRAAVTAGRVRTSIGVVADHRGVLVAPLGSVLSGYGDIGQADWLKWRARNRLEDALPASFSGVVDAVEQFIDPVLAGDVEDSATWEPGMIVWK